MTDTGTDNRRFNFFMIDNEVLDHYDLNPFEGWLYIAIVRHINQQSGIAFPSLSTLADKTNMSEPTVVKYLKSLEEKKLITITGQYDEATKTNKANHYTIMGVVKEVNQGGKGALPGVVKEVYTNNTKGKKKDQKTTTPTPDNTDPDGDVPASADNRGDSFEDVLDHLELTQADLDAVEDDPILEDWKERGYVVGQMAWWWYEDGNKYVAGEIVRFTKHYAYFKSKNKAGEFVNQQIGVARCSVDGSTEGWHTLDDLTAMEEEIAVGSYGMSEDQAVSGGRLSNIRGHVKYLRTQFQNGHEVDAGVLCAAYGWQKAQSISAPKRSDALADMVNGYREAKAPAQQTTTPSPVDEADPNCPRCNGGGVLRLMNSKKLVPCSCRDKDRN